MDEPRSIVERGYDTVAARYAQERLSIWSTPEEDAFLDRIVASIRPGAEILDLGCGSGEPVTARLARHGRVTAVDLSRRMLSMARERVPSAVFVQADMTSVRFPSGAFDAVVAFFSIIHVPRDEHAALFASIAAWLRPGGIFVAVLGGADNPEERVEWLGAPMYWSHFDREGSLTLLRRVGFEVLEACDLPAPDGVSAGVIARRPGAS